MYIYIYIYNLIWCAAAQDQIFTHANICSNLILGPDLRRICRVRALLAVAPVAL
jgi:hypothetical protein